MRDEPRMRGWNNFQRRDVSTCEHIQSSVRHYHLDDVQSLFTPPAKWLPALAGGGNKL